MSRKTNNKYNNKKVWVDGIKFDSEAEAHYYTVLRDRQSAGEIFGLQLQVKFEIIPKVEGEKIEHLKTKDKTVKYCIQKATNYVADFMYIDGESGDKVVVDVKSPVTAKNPVYLLKKKMMLAFNGIKLKEVVYSGKKQITK